MAAKLKIALDMDDTIAGTIRHVFAVYRKPAPKIWQFSNVMLYEKFMRDVKISWEMHWGQIRPMEPGQAGMVRNIAEFGEVDIVTVDFPGQKAEWLKLHGIRYHDMVSVRRGQDKAALDYDVFIDDSPVNFQAFKEAGKPCVLFDAPYNLDVDAEYRITSLDQAADVLRHMA